MFLQGYLPQWAFMCSEISQKAPDWLDKHLPHLMGSLNKSKQQQYNTHTDTQLVVNPLNTPSWSWKPQINITTVEALISAALCKRIQKVIFSRLHVSSNEILRQEWQLVECVWFFQEVMIISRKNNRVHAREGGIFAKLLWEAKGQSDAGSHKTITWSLFVWRLSATAFCVALIQIESRHTVDMCVYCVHPVFGKHFLSHRVYIGACMSESYLEDYICDLVLVFDHICVCSLFGCRDASGKSTCGRAVPPEGWRRWSEESTRCTWSCRFCWSCSSLPPSPSPCGAATPASARSAAPAWATRITTTSCRWSPWTIGAGITTKVTNQNSASTAARHIKAPSSHQGEEALETPLRLMTRLWAIRMSK